MKAQTIPDWAKTVKQLRLLLSLTQKQFAERYGVTQPAVAQWESGRSEPPAAVIFEAIKAVG
jgi:transcriptional regulator with XRE-family HTH domain